MKFLSNIRLLLVGLWLGAALFFSFAVAPSAFAVLPSREHAGALVSRSLMIVNYAGLIIGLILLVSSFFREQGVNRFLLWAERLLLLLFTAACAVSQFVIGLWLSFVRAEIGRPIEELAADDPLKIQFDNLHESSVWVMFAAMVAALLAFFVIAGKRFDGLKQTTPKEIDFERDFKI